MNKVRNHEEYPDSRNEKYCTHNGNTRNKLHLECLYEAGFAS